MNRNTVENSVLEEKKKNDNFFSRLYTNSRVLVIILSALVITVISIAIYFKSSDYTILYENLSKEDEENILNELQDMNIPYRFSEDKHSLLVPKNNIDVLRLHFSTHNFSTNHDIGFELLDNAKFGISQFNEKINYQRALEGELSRTIRKINFIKNARIHIALPKSSLFLQDKKSSSASVILTIKPNRSLNSNQINSIVHFISSSVPELSIKNITILDQFGKLLNQPFLGDNQINDMNIRYIEAIENHYSNRIQTILEPLLGIGNVHSQVTAEIDFNVKEQTENKYLPNIQNINPLNYPDKTIIYNQIPKINSNKKISSSISNNINSAKNLKGFINDILPKNKFIIKNNDNMHNFPIVKQSHIDQKNILKYDFNHLIRHTKMHVGDIKRLSAAVIVNMTKNKDGKIVSLTDQKLKNINHLVREAIGYSANRGDSIYVMNDFFVKNNITIPIKLNHINFFNQSHIYFFIISCCLIVICIIFVCCKYFFSSLQNTKKNQIYEKEIEEENKKALNPIKEDIQSNLNTDELLHQICNISNKNPRIIALIIRKWMSNKI